MSESIDSGRGADAGPGTPSSDSAALEMCQRDPFDDEMCLLYVCEIVHSRVRALRRRWRLTGLRRPAIFVSSAERGR